MTVSLIQAAPWAASLAALAGSGVTDLRARLIPNEFAALIAVCGVALGLRFGAGQLCLSLLVAAAVFFALGILAHYNVIGGGDVKLIGAVTLLAPPDRVGLLLVEIALAGGVLSCFYLAAGFVLRRLHRRYRHAGKTSGKSGFSKWARREGIRIAAGYPMPYALAVLGGVASYIIRELPQCLSATSCSL
jgi:prepilin peptidase CpaA